MAGPAGSMIPKVNISGYKQRVVPQYTNAQMQLFNALLGGAQHGVGQGLGFLSRLAGGDQSAFAEREAPAMRQLQGQLGQIGSRFANVGALGSSGFQQLASGAATDLAERLSSERLGIQQNALDRLLALSESILGQRPYQQSFERKADFGSILGKLFSLGGAQSAVGFGDQMGSRGGSWLSKLLGI